MSSSVSLRIRWPPCCSSSMTPRARYVGDKVGRDHLERAAVKVQRGERRHNQIQRGKRAEKRPKSQRQSEPGIEVLVSTHGRFPIGRRAPVLSPGQSLAGKKCEGCLMCFYSPGSSPLMDLRR